MRICYLADAMSPHTRKWVRHFAGRGDDVHVISFRPAEIDGATVHHVPPPWVNGNTDLLYAGRNNLQKAAYLLTARKVRRKIRNIAPDILHAFLATSYAFAGAVSGFHPFVVSSLGSEVVVLPEKSAFYRRLLRFNLGRADLITATSGFLSEVSSRYVSGDTAVETVPFGVDTEVFSPEGRGYSAGRPLVIGTVKILEHNYGIDRLIEAFEKVAAGSSDPGISLLIVGGGSMEAALKKMVHRLGLADRITFVGNLPHAKVASFFDQIDIFVSLPQSESFGVSVVEASACGIPAVVSDVGGLPEVVRDGETGFLVPPHDIDAAARRIDELAQDWRLRRKMGMAARRLALERYDWKDTAGTMTAIYEQLTMAKAGVHH